MDMVSTSLPYSIIAVEVDHNADAEAVWFGENNLICRTCVSDHVLLVRQEWFAHSRSFLGASGTL